MRWNTRGPSGQARRGQSLVELSVALPLLLLFLLGTLDVGRAFFDYIQMRNAVVEGATYGQRQPLDTGGIVGATEEHGLPADAVVSVSADGNCNVPGATGNVTVEATRVFTPIFFGTLSAISDGMSWSFALHVHETMRCLT
jgi:Flp pilus assembly protein TadG